MCTCVAQSYAKQLSRANEWPEPRRGSAVVWCEPMAFGGRRKLIGDSNDFQEMVSTYYGLTSLLSSCDVVKIAHDNHAIKIQVSVIPAPGEPACGLFTYALLLPDEATATVYDFGIVANFL